MTDQGRCVQVCCYLAEEPVLVLCCCITTSSVAYEYRFIISELLWAGVQAQLRSCLCLVYHQGGSKTSGRLHSQWKTQLGKNMFLNSLRLLVEPIALWLGVLRASFLLGCRLPSAPRASCSSWRPPVVLKSHPQFHVMFSNMAASCIKPARIDSRRNMPAV